MGTVDEPERREMAMVKTVLSIDVRPGRGPEFEKAWAALAASISYCPGNLGQALMREAGQPDRYLITSDWHNVQALRAFEASDERREMSTALEPLRDSATKTVFDIVTEIAGGPGTRS